MQGLKGVFQALNLINQEELENTYANQIGGDVWDLRIKGLTQKLEKPELMSSYKKH